MNDEAANEKNRCPGERKHGNEPGVVMHSWINDGIFVTDSIYPRREQMIGTSLRANYEWTENELQIYNENWHCEMELE